jgi:site-specific DNA recombinase
LVYIGKVKHEGECYEGEHDAIIDEALFAEVQEILKAQGRTRGVHGGNGHLEALLKSLLTCGLCGKAMIHSVTKKRDGTRYRYYVCTTSQKAGVDACPTSTIPAAELEGFVIGQIKQIATHPTMIARVVQHAKEMQAQRLPQLDADIQHLQEHLQERQRAGRNLAHALETNEGQTPAMLLLDQLHAIEAQITETNRRLSEAPQDITTLSSCNITIADFRDALELFDPVWEVLYPTERARILRLLIEKADLDCEAEMTEHLRHFRLKSAVNAQ